MSCIEEEFLQDRIIYISGEVNVDMSDNVIKSLVLAILYIGIIYLFTLLKLCISVSSTASVSSLEIYLKKKT